MKSYLHHAHLSESQRLRENKILSNNHLSRNSDTTISQNSALAICCWSLRTEQIEYLYKELSNNRLSRNSDSIVQHRTTNARICGPVFCAFWPIFLKKAFFMLTKIKTFLHRLLFVTVSSHYLN